MVRNYPESLLNYCTDTQVNCMMSNRDRVAKWGEEDIANAITLKCISPKAYRLIQNVWKLPLPAPSTLDRWVSNIKCEHGILHSVLRLMQIRSATLNDAEKLCSLSFDEMSITQKYVYNHGADRIYSPNSKVQSCFANHFQVHPA